MDQSTTDIKDRVRVRPSEPARRWNPAAALVGAFVVVLAIVGAVFLLRGESGPVAAADANPVITCDGESCTYDGPTSILEGEVEITFANDGPRDMILGVWSMHEATELAAELERTPVDTDRALDPGDPVPDGGLRLTLEVAAGQEATGSVFLWAPQTHLIDCLTTATDATGDGYNDHLWRVAEIEVLEP